MLTALELKELFRMFTFVVAACARCAKNATERTNATAATRRKFEILPKTEPVRAFKLSDVIAACFALAH